MLRCEIVKMNAMQLATLISVVVITWMSKSPGATVSFTYILSRAFAYEFGTLNINAGQLFAAVISFGCPDVVTRWKSITQGAIKFFPDTINAMRDSWLWQIIKTIVTYIWWNRKIAKKKCTRITQTLLIFCYLLSAFHCYTSPSTTNMPGGKV